MKLIKAAAAVLNQTPFDWDHNVDNIRKAIAEARRQYATVLCLPELCITGYGCEDDFFRIDLRERAVDILFSLLPETKGMVVSFGLPLSFHNALFNCAALAVDGKLIGFVAKQNLAGDGIHYEPRWFESWPENVVHEINLKGSTYPLGDIYFSVGDVRFGFEICEDAWVGRRTGAKLASRGVDVILNPSASHFSFGKLEIRKRLVLEGSRAFSSTYVYANLLGNEAGRAIYDGGAIIASAGKLLAIGPRFSFQDCVVTSAVVDIDHTRMAQSRTYSYRPDFSEERSSCIEIDFLFPAEAPPETPIADDRALWETSSNLKEEELARSVSLALFDYMRKSRSNGYVVSLSGGADSASVACLISLLVELAIQDLGLDGFKKKLGYLTALQEQTSSKSIIASLLTCVYQATENSTSDTLNSAKQVCEYLGGRFFNFDVQPVVNDYINIVQKAIGRDLTWQKDDIALQNIQARVRSPGVWLLANLSGSLLVSTSNRSEGAVGYCTMDGDTSGGLSPIAGVDKHFIRRWLRWMEKAGPVGLHAYTGLSAVNNQTPGPELRPKEMRQSGESDLMPYDLLDAIEEAAIESNQSVLDCYRLMRARFPQYQGKQLAAWIERFFRLWSRNQWKRERLAPALHVDSRNLDPRTWRRSPILSGGFAKEIKEMWDFVADEVAQKV